jgi:predicted DNA-binding transcriptional regulator AlpA
MRPRDASKRVADVQPDELLTTEAAAVRVGLSPVTLKVWRWQKNPHAPPHVRVGARNIRYSAIAIERWKADRTCGPDRKSVSQRRKS